MEFASRDPIEDDRSFGSPSLYSPPVADLPIELPTELADRLAVSLDAEGKIVRALDALGPLAGRDVVLLGRDELRRRQLTELGARVTPIPWPIDGARAPRAESADAVVGLWSPFRGLVPTEVAAAERLLRPRGRLLVVHDYGRDDVSRLRGDLPDYGSWTRRDGPFLASGFRIRVVHCWWTFASVEEARAFLGSAFGEVGERFGADLRRPRLSYNVAIYHRTRSESGGPS